MKINIRNNIKSPISPFFLDYLNKKIESLKRILDSFSGEKEFFVEISQIENKNFKIKIILNVLGKDIIAIAKSKEINEAIDRAKDKIKRQLTKTKNLLSE